MALTPLQRKKLEEEMERRKYFESSEKKRAHIEEKNRYGNLSRYINIQRREQEECNAMQKVIENEAFREKRFDQEKTLARELDKIKRTEMKDMLLRQQLRENSHELRDLERTLKATYTNKALHAQIAEKEAEKINEKIQDKRTFDHLKKVWKGEEELRTTLKQEEILKKNQYKRELQDQIISREKAKRYQYEEFLREKKMIDDIIQRIHDEDEREMYERMCKIKTTRDDMVAFKQAQELWKKKKAEEIEEENRKIQEFLASKAAGIKANMEEKEKLEKMREQISDDIAKKLYADMVKNKEREEMVQELLELEKKEEIEKRAREDLEKTIRKRIDIIESLDRQMKEKEERERFEAKENAIYREQILAKLAEDAKVEQMSQQKKRMKMMQLRRDVEQMILDKRQKYAEEMQLEIKLQEEQEEEMEKRRKVIEEERIVLLQEHVKNLIGYLPKGLLTAKDLPHLGADVVDQIIQNKGDVPH